MATQPYKKATVWLPRLTDASYGTRWVDPPSDGVRSTKGPLRQDLVIDRGVVMHRKGDVIHWNKWRMVDGEEVCTVERLNTDAGRRFYWGLSIRRLMWWRKYSRV